MFVSQQNKFECQCTHNYSERCQVLIEQVHSQYFSGYRSISLEVVSLEYFKKKSIHHTYDTISFSFIQWKRSGCYHRCNTTFYSSLIFSYKRVHIFSLENHVGSHRWLRKAVSLFTIHLSTIMYCFIILYYYWQSIWITCTWQICCWWSEL